jgi:hypothetical protein
MLSATRILENSEVFKTACAYLKQATGKECEFEVLPYIPEQDLEAQKRLALLENNDALIFSLYPNPAKLFEI